MLRQLLGTVAMGVRGQCVLRGGIRHQQYPLWRLAGLAHPSLPTPLEVIAQLCGRTKMEVFYRAATSLFRFVSIRFDSPIRIPNFAAGVK